MGFIVYLVRRGALQPAQAIEVLEHQVRRRPRIGAMAVERGLLRPEHVTEVIAHQSREPRRFGETCVRLGHLQQDDVERLADAQERALPPVQGLVLALDLVEGNRLQALWQDYVREER